MKEAVTKVIDTLTQGDFHGAFQKFLAGYNKCITAVLSIKVPTRKKGLETYLMILVSRHIKAEFVGAIEYTECISTEG